MMADCNWGTGLPQREEKVNTGAAINTDEGTGELEAHCHIE